MELQTYPRLGEQCFRRTLANGLPVMIVPRPGFTKKLCYFVTDFGAIHTEFTLDGKAWSVPRASPTIRSTRCSTCPAGM